MIDQYVSAAATLVASEGAASELALTTLESMTHNITREVKEQLETGFPAAVKELIEVSADEKQCEALRLPARKVADQILASKAQSQVQNAELDSLIEQLRNF